SSVLCSTRSECARRRTAVRPNKRHDNRCTVHDALQTGTDHGAQFRCGDEAPLQRLGHRGEPVRPQIPHVRPFHIPAFRLSRAPILAPPPNVVMLEPRAAPIPLSRGFSSLKSFWHPFGYRSRPQGSCCSSSFSCCSSMNRCVTASSWSRVMTSDRLAGASCSVVG